MGSLFLVVRLFVFSITIVLIVNFFNDNDWGSNPGGFKYYIPETQQKSSNKMELFPNYCYEQRLWGLAKKINCL